MKDINREAIKQGILNKIDELSAVIDIEGLMFDIDYELGQLLYFHKNVLPKTHFYHMKAIPKQGEVAYFNLTRGFPKELVGGHWCLVLKYVKGKALVVPLTSIKEDSAPVDPEFQIDIQVEGFKCMSRAQISDIRTIDVQRCYIKKGFKRVITNQEEIYNKIHNTLLYAG